MKASSPYCVKFWCWKTWSPQSTSPSIGGHWPVMTTFSQIKQKTNLMWNFQEFVQQIPFFNSLANLLINFPDKVFTLNLFLVVKIKHIPYEPSYLYKAFEQAQKKMFWISSPAVHLIKTSQFPVLTTKACKLPPPPPGEKHGTACWCFLGPLQHWCLQSEFLPSWAILGNQQITDCPEH